MTADSRVGEEAQRVSDCLFCHRIAAGDVTDANAHAAAFADGYPVAAGHTLVVPRRHVASVFDLAGAASRGRRRLYQPIAVSR